MVIASFIPSCVREGIIAEFAPGGIRMSDSLAQKPPTGDTEMAGSTNCSTARELPVGTSVAKPPTELGAEAHSAVAPETVPQEVALPSAPPTALPTIPELNVPDQLNTRKVLAKGSYLSSQVGLLLSKYTRIRSDLLVVARSGLIGERYSYAERVADYLRQAKEELESSRQNLPVTASVLSS